MTTTTGTACSPCDEYDLAAIRHRQAVEHALAALKQAVNAAIHHDHVHAPPTSVCIDEIQAELAEHWRAEEARWAALDARFPEQASYRRARRAAVPPAPAGGQGCGH
jgi:hypothetical protein